MSCITSEDKHDVQIKESPTVSDANHGRRKKEGVAAITRKRQQYAHLLAVRACFLEVDCRKPLLIHSNIGRHEQRPRNMIMPLD